LVLTETQTIPGVWLAENFIQILHFRKKKKGSEKKMKWRVVGFNHPLQEKSVVYRQGLNEAQLIETIRKGIENG